MSYNVTITALLNDNGNQGNVATPLTSSGTITVAVVPDPNAQALIDITTITTGSGEKTKHFMGVTYLFHYALPHFYFHATTAYDILRHNGIEIGKKDFIGSY